MNAALTAHSPTASSPTVAPPARRRLVGGQAVAASALARFNRALGQLGRPAVGLDQLATLARNHAGRPSCQPPGWIAERLRRAATIRLMAADPAWHLAPALMAATSVVTAYLQDRDDLIPDDLPRIGRFDDAMVVDAAWPMLGEEVRSYLDFCRIRHVEAGLRGCADADFAFDRADWIEASRAEQAWIAHCRDTGQRSYLPPAGPARFRVC